MSEPLKENEIRVLAVRQPWASLIVEGLKTIEVRSKPTNIRERVAIYSTMGIPTLKTMQNCFCTLKRHNYYKKMGDREKEIFENLKYVSDTPYYRGKIIGTVEIEDCIHFDVLTDSGIEEIYKRSYAPYSDINDTFYFWKLSNPIKIETPIPYKPPNGAIVWSKTELPEGY